MSSLWRRVGPQHLAQAAVVQPRRTWESLGCRGFPDPADRRLFHQLVRRCVRRPGFIRWLITKCRLNRYDGDRSWLFRFNDAPWYYLLTGADFDKDHKPDFIEATAIVNIAGEPYLFKGVLESFYFKSDGTLARLVLENTTRRKLNEDKRSRRRRAAARPEGGFSPIDGDSFVIQYDQVVTMNIRYKKIDLASADGTPQQGAATAAAQE